MIKPVFFLLRLILLVIVVIICVAFCISNQQDIVLFLHPLPVAITIPQYLFGAIMVFTGLLLGVFSSHFYHYRKIRKMSRNLRMAQKDITALKQHDKTQQVEALGQEVLIKKYGIFR